MLAERWDTSETTSCQLAEDGDSLQELRSGVATVTAELQDGREAATETAEESTLGRDDAVLQLKLRGPLDRRLVLELESSGTTGATGGKGCQNIAVVCNTWQAE